MIRAIPAIRIRPFHPQDAEALATLLHESVRELGAEDYSHAQIRAWSPAPVSTSQFLARVSDGRRSVLVATAPGDTPTGFIELCANGYIDCFYCHPHAAGTGVGGALYRHLEQFAANANISLLTVDASEAARRFFLRHGFTTIKRQEFQRHGVLIHNYRMEKRLTMNSDAADRPDHRPT